MNQHRAVSCTVMLFLCVQMLFAAEQSPGRKEIPLSGEWQFRRAEAAEDSWKKVSVPSSFQSHEGTNWHGKGVYRRQVSAIAVPAGMRVLLHFQAAATEAEVFWNGKRLGSHLGGWTPFRFEISELLKDPPAGGEHTLEVRLDEKVGHNTQGFLPIIAPHFGGLWQDVSLLMVPETYIDDLRILAVGEPATGRLRVEFPVHSRSGAAPTNIQLRAGLRGSGGGWERLSPTIEVSNSIVTAKATLSSPRLWSPAEPNLYDVVLSLGGPDADQVQLRAAFRTIEADGPQFRINGHVFSIRGLLNWGYSPPLFEPNPGEATWKSELDFARSHGFNLMKFCLWIPPKRYLELADEMGMLTWMEYPTWHPDFSEKHLENLKGEFREFFYYDRNHPSIILRSLTCETGPSADLKVIRSLYDLAHAHIPGALVEDDSSWIGWNRVHDFYDDHPYGNNHDWVGRLQGFEEYIMAHGLKPLILGESVSADTWIDRPAILRKLGEDRPWWAPGPLDESARWMEWMRGIAGEEGLKELLPESLHYGLLMRKFQVEAFRRELPYSGYVVSVIRDVPKASMGLIDYLSRPKWQAAEWSWQGDTMLLLKTAEDRRSYSSGESLNSTIFLSHFGGDEIDGASLETTLESLNPPSVMQKATARVSQKPATLAEVASLNWKLPTVETPSNLMVRAVLTRNGSKIQNEWPIWVVPPVRPYPAVEFHSSFPASLTQELFQANQKGGPADSESNRIIVARRFDPELCARLEKGARVLMFPDGQKHSFALSAHWFLRGAPYIPGHAFSQSIPRRFWLELQHFDLASQVVPSLGHLESFDPILMLWDTHDLDMVKTHGLVFETRVGTGRLLVSAVNHGGDENAAGKWLLGSLLEHLATGPQPRQSLPSEVWAHLQHRLTAEQTNLANVNWQFRPDPKNTGLAEGWQKRETPTGADWKPIKIASRWESEGYPALDGWAWYRLEVPVPAHWNDIYLSFEGVDDIYELYVNGELVGKGGDLATRKDALSEKRSYQLKGRVEPGKTAVIAVRVHDWYGGGGIFRPVTLGTLEFKPDLDLLR